MRYSVDIHVAKIPIFAPNAPEYEEEYSEETWHLEKTVEAYRVSIHDLNSRQSKCLEGPHDQIDGKALVACLKRCISEIEAHEPSLCPTP